MNIYYVYVYLDTTKKGEYVYENYTFNYKPFYVGKGKNDRYLDHIKRLNERTTINKHKNNTIKRIIDETGELPLIDITIDNLTEKEAFDTESRLISLIGLDNLTNYHIGGQGGDTWSNKDFEEVEFIKQKISKTKKGLNYEDLVGVDLAKEWKDKISKKSKESWDKDREFRLSKIPKGPEHGMWGKTNSFSMTEESKNKIRESKLGCKNPNSKKYKVTNPNGEKYEVCSLNNFCKENGLSKAMMYMVARGESKHHKGWLCEEI